MTEPLLQVRGLKVHFQTSAGLVRAVDGVSYDLYAGRTLALVGESGCGKSVGAMTILRLNDRQPGVHLGGEVFFEGRPLHSVSDREMRGIRGNRIGMIFQEPMTSLNPVYTVGAQIDEVLRLHGGLSRSAARKESVRMLDLVGIPSAERRADEYPHQLSGGMRQRVMIAMALSCRPRLLIADEPTTALDVTIQAQILRLIRRLQEHLDMAVLLITHDLGVVAGAADDVAVMYAGRVVERAPTDEILSRPLHPYTQGLLASLPSAAALKPKSSGRRLPTIEGRVPDALSFPSGCRFHPRCERATTQCKGEAPVLSVVEEGTGHAVACHHVAAGGAS